MADSDGRINGFPTRVLPGKEGEALARLVAYARELERRLAAVELRLKAGGL